MKLIETKNGLLNPFFLVRYGGLPLDFLEHDEEGVFEIIEEYNKLKKWRGEAKDNIVELLHSFIKDEKDNSLSRLALRLKREVFNERIPKDISIYDSLYSSFQSNRLKRLYKIWEYSGLKSLELESEFQNKYKKEELTNFNNLLFLASNNSEFLKGLILSSPSTYKSLKKNILNPPDKIKAKERKLNTSLLKYMSRATYKTSPFSYFGVVGVGQWGSKNILSGKVLPISSISENITLRFLDIEEEKYFINPNVWQEESLLKLLSRKDGQLSNVTYLSSESIISFKTNHIVNYLIECQEIRDGLSYLDIYNLIKKKFNKEYIESDIKELIGDLIKINFFIKKPKCNTGNKEHILKMSSMAKRFSNCDLDERTKIYDTLKSEINKTKIDNSNDKVPLFEDCIIEDKLELDKVEWNDSLDDLSEFKKVLLIFDLSIVKSINMGEFYRKSYGDKEISIINFIEDYTSFLEENNYYNLNDKRKYEFNPFNLSAISELKQCRDNLLCSIEDQSDLTSINFNSNIVEEAYKMIPTKIKKRPSSLLFLVQPSKGKSLVVNQILQGYTRFFSRYSSYLPWLEEELKETLKSAESNYNVKFVELLESFGFNINIHPKLTENIIDYSGYSNGTNHLTDLNLCYNPNEESVNVKFQNKEVIKPLHLGQMSFSQLPIVYEFLANMTSSDSINIRLAETIFNKKMNDDPGKMAYYIPEVSFNKIILSRKQWWINVNEIKEKLKELSIFKFYCYIVEFFENHSIPKVFFMSPTYYSNVSNIDKADDYFKPQYIDIKKIEYLNIFIKNVKSYSKVLKIEEVNPSTENIIEANSIRRQTEIGVELY